MYVLSMQIEEELPALKLFRNGWASEYLVKDSFNGRRAYASVKNRKRMGQRVVEQPDGDAEDAHMSDIEADNITAKDDQMYTFEGYNNEAEMETMED